MSFHESLAAATAAARTQLFAVPVIVDSLSGRVTRAQYVAFLTQAYHHVSQTVPLLMACGAALPSRKAWLRDAMAEYIEEERGHDEWILADIEVAGGDAAAVRAGIPAPATELMVAYVRDFIASRNPVGFLGMVYVLEGTSVAIALNAADAIQHALRLPGTAMRYLRSHGQVDREHVQFFAALVDRLDEDADRADVVHVANMVYRLYADIFRTLPRVDAPAEAVV